MTREEKIFVLRCIHVLKQLYNMAGGSSSSLLFYYEICEKLDISHFEMLMYVKALNVRGYVVKTGRNWDVMLTESGVEYASKLPDTRAFAHLEL